MRSRVRAEEAGATLIELLVAIALSGMLMAALAGAMFTGLRTTRDTTTSLDQSNAEQVISTYVTRDIQSADAVSTAPSGACGNEPVVLETTTKSDALAPTDNVTVAYRLTVPVLTRQVCG